MVCPFPFLLLLTERPTVYPLYTHSPVVAVTGQVLAGGEGDMYLFSLHADRKVRKRCHDKMYGTVLQRPFPRSIPQSKPHISMQQNVYTHSSASGPPRAKAPRSSPRSRCPGRWTAAWSTRAAARWPSRPAVMGHKAIACWSA